MISVDIAIPAYNEEKQLAKSITKLRRFIAKNEFLDYKITIIIVNNASTDATPEIARSLAARFENVKFRSLPQKGRGGALLACWQESRADVLAYMDVDLSADLVYLKNLLDTISTKGVDIAIGSRLAKGAKVSGRTLIREVMSRGYNWLLDVLFQTSFKDAQCGFKAVSRQTFQRLAPLIKSRNWFFDSEMLIIAMKAGFQIKEIPIAWRDDPGSTVKVAKTAKEDLLGILRLLRTKPWKDIAKR
ncbi:glycosyltransferase [Patescibacteria group bacterium]|nr:glycosyltransferase [Patescibacteria group bacterium]